MPAFYAFAYQYNFGEEFTKIRVLNPETVELVQMTLRANQVKLSALDALRANHKCVLVVKADSLEKITEHGELEALPSQPHYFMHIDPPYGGD